MSADRRSQPETSATTSFTTQSIAITGQSRGNFSFLQTDITDRDAIHDLLATHFFDVVVHLAAQAGVRYSIENPFA